jgi:ketosteroid isomerase-like protein
LYDAIAGKTDTAAEAVLDEASLLHVSGRSGLAGHYQGGDAILGLLRRMAELTDGTLRFRPSRVLTANESAIVVCGRATASRHGRRLDSEEVHVVSLRDGKVREIWIFHEDQGRIDEFWAAGGKPG